jgi:hypothetical protein
VRSASGEEGEDGCARCMQIWVQLVDGLEVGRVGMKATAVNVDWLFCGCWKAGVEGVELFVPLRPLLDDASCDRRCASGLRDATLQEWLVVGQKTQHKTLHRDRVVGTWEGET